MNNGAAWGGLLMLGLLIVIVGITGTLGRLIAVVFVPSELEVI